MNDVNGQNEGLGIIPCQQDPHGKNTNQRTFPPLKEEAEISSN
jgi:hypothetical protein